MLRAEIPIPEYEKLAPQFNPVKYDAEQIVKLAKQAGQKYIVLTSKHHDGFCMFGSEETDYNIVDATPYGRDILKDLADACAREGIKLGLYYSQTQDWHHPNGFGNTWDFNESEQDFGDYIDNYVKPQVREILTNYGPICIIWFDTPRIIERQQSQELLDLVHSIAAGLPSLRTAGQQAGRLRHRPGQRHPARPASRDRLGDARHHQRHLGLQDPRPQLEIDDAADSKSGRHRQQRRQLSAEYRPRCRRRDSPSRASSGCKRWAPGWMCMASQSIGTEPGPIQGEAAYRTTQKGATASTCRYFDWPAERKNRTGPAWTRGQIGDLA